ncbi:hypothetical protein LSTR_LSTR015442 [Laodelphax striatellus]|uniref:Uncharacterized protein n=1 Tax=Laodelphax striatellus TaxID=195883 RepID=A0A482XKJ3_LAOST|nr:hypothetical protein LSTR_LSTR015442 [Laodelphax striatellus]
MMTSVSSNQGRDDAAAAVADRTIASSQDPNNGLESDFDPDPTTALSASGLPGSLMTFVGGAKKEGTSLLFQPDSWMIDATNFRRIHSDNKRRKASLLK